MHSSVETEKQWNDEFKCQLYFSHGNNNSCGVLTGFYGNIIVVNEMKTPIHSTKIFLDQNDTVSNQSKWEFLKYEIRKKRYQYGEKSTKLFYGSNVNVKAKIISLQCS